jgi:hypothetical protein
VRIVRLWPTASVVFWKPDGELALELAAGQQEPRTVAKVLVLCRAHRVHARLSDASGAERGKIDPDRGFSPP